jgi:chromosome segregation ATPase
MNETQQLETLWQILESRDRVVTQACQERSRLYQESSLVQQERDGLKQKCNGLKQECQDLRKHCNNLEEQITDIRIHNSELQTDNKTLNQAIKVHAALIQELREEKEQLTVKLQINQAQKESFQHVIEQRETTIEEIKGQLQDSENDRLLLWAKIDKLQENLNENKATIEGMESSKFWQLREGLIKLKNILRLTRDN